MHLLAALGLNNADELDPEKPLNVQGFNLSSEAAAEASRILSDGKFDQQVTLRPAQRENTMYWSVQHRVEGSGEIFVFSTLTETLPTAIEIGIVRALAVLAPSEHSKLLEGGCEVRIGNPKALETFGKIVSGAQQPLSGDSILMRLGCQITAEENCHNLLSDTAQKCFSNSFLTAPLKFRFLELYRVMEALFLDNIKQKIFTRFNAEPKEALEEGIESLKSEMNQLTELARLHKTIFEDCWSDLASLKETNRFTAALFRKIKNRLKGENAGKWQMGAALIYYIRCAIVHAGEKDMIYEGFIDGEVALSVVLPSVEKAALALVGFAIQ